MSDPENESDEHADDAVDQELAEATAQRARLQAAMAEADEAVERAQTTWALKQTRAAEAAEAKRVQAAEQAAAAEETARAAAPVFPTAEQKQQAAAFIAGVRGNKQHPWWHQDDPGHERAVFNMLDSQRWVEGMRIEEIVRLRKEFEPKGGA
jgi:hypothetical protein